MEKILGSKFNGTDIKRMLYNSFLLPSQYMEDGKCYIITKVVLPLQWYQDATNPKTPWVVRINNLGGGDFKVFENTEVDFSGLPEDYWDDHATYVTINNQLDEPPAIYGWYSGVGGTGVLIKCYPPSGSSDYYHPTILTKGTYYEIGGGVGRTTANAIVYGYEVDCETGEPLLNVTTLVATNITESEEVVTATINGEIAATGGENADERGFDYGLTDSYGSSWTEEGDFGIGSFAHVLTELLPYTTYHFRAKAHNSAGWAYGEDLTFGYYPGAGYLWVEGTTLCYTDMDAGKMVITGTNIGGSHTPGHVWVEGHNLHYIDQSGAERWIEGVFQDGSLPGNAGYIWIEETHIHFIDSSGEERYAVL